MVTFLCNVMFIAFIVCQPWLLINADYFLPINTQKFASHCILFSFKSLRYFLCIFLIEDFEDGR